MKTPKYWRKNNSLISIILIPLSYIWFLALKFKLFINSPKKTDIPLICIGNVTAGGAGKTPVTIALAKILIKKGLKAHILSHGYGGSQKTSTKVNENIHNVEKVGDEAILCSRIAPTWISKNKYKGVKNIILAGAQIIITDDGFQNNKIKKNFSFLVLDGSTGLGNNRIIPAGPLRESLNHAIKRANAVIIVNKDHQGLTTLIPKHTPVIASQIKVNNKSKKYLYKKSVIGFTGIGYPEKFLETIKNEGAIVKKFHIFGDHHNFTNIELEKLFKQAQQLKATCVTTSKDYVRIPKLYRDNVREICVTLEFKNTKKLENLLKEIIEEKNYA